MKEIPNSVKRLVHMNTPNRIRGPVNNKRVQYYMYITETGGCRTFQVTKPLCRGGFDDEITEYNTSSNGFITVRFSNGEFGYVRVSDGDIMPYRYDIAFDFNEYGLAMVGKGDFVTWINTNFEFLTNTGEFVPDIQFSNWITFKKHAFVGIDAFDGDIPLSRVWEYTIGDTVSYVSTDGKFVNFYEDGNPENTPLTKISAQEFRNFTRQAFLHDVAFTNFNEHGYILLNGRLLLSNGSYYNLEKLIREGFSTGKIYELIGQQDAKKHVITPVEPNPEEKNN